jgi:hypothetical protein
MFDSIATTTTSIANKLKSTTGTVKTVVQYAAHYTKRGCIGYMHLVTDTMYAAFDAYEAAIEADTVRGTLGHAATGFFHNFAAGIHIATASEAISQGFGIASNKAAGKAASRGALRGFTGNLLFVFAIGNLYESVRVTDDEDDVDLKTVDDTDIIDGEDVDQPDIDSEPFDPSTHTAAEGVDEDAADIDIGPQPADD